MALAWACADAPPLNGGVASSGGIASGGAASGASGSAANGVSGSVGVSGVGISGSSAGGVSGGVSSVGGAGGVSAGAGGGAGVAGIASNAGSGGAVVVPPHVPPVSHVNCGPAPVGGLTPLVADFEDGLKIIPQDGRGGIWFEYADGSGTQTNPIPIVASDAGGQAMHVVGKGFTNWGSGIGSAIAFDFGKNVQCPYDVSLFDGISVRVKGTGTAHLRITQVEMTPATAGDRKGSCDPSTDVCEGHYEVAIELTSTWTVHRYKWNELAQPFGNPQPFNPKSVLGVSFEFHAPIDYDFWLDDVAFLATGSAGEGGAGAGGASG